MELASVACGMMMGVGFSPFTARESTSLVVAWSSSAVEWGVPVEMEIMVESSSFSVADDSLLVPDSDGKGEVSCIFVFAD